MPDYFTGKGSIINKNFIFIKKGTEKSRLLFNSCECLLCLHFDVISDFEKQTNESN